MPKGAGLTTANDAIQVIIFGHHCSFSAQSFIYSTLLASLVRSIALIISTHQLRQFDQSEELNMLCNEKSHIFVATGDVKYLL